MIVCVCNRISDREITRQARAGMSFDDIQLELGVATCCGRCEGCARHRGAVRTGPPGGGAAPRRPGHRPARSEGLMAGTSAALWAALGSLVGVLIALAWVFGGLRRRPPRP